MSARLAHRGRDGDARRLDGAVGFACQHFWVTPEEQGERQPIVGSSGAMLVLDGRIDNRSELIGALRLDAQASDARLVLAAYDLWGDRFAARLNGDFATAIFDRRTGRLLLARDAIGIRTLYYFHSPRLFAFASEIKALLAHPLITATPDSEGVADFTLVGSRPLERQDLTCFRDIASVVPAHLVTVTQNGVHKHRYWDFDTTRSLRFQSFDEYVEAFRERFAEAVKRRLRSAYPVAMSVSGGLDSSSVFCQAETLRRAGVVTAPPVAGVAYVSDRRETDEQQFLRKIEEEYGVSFDRFLIEPRTGIVCGAKDQISAIEAPFIDYLWGVTRELHTRATGSGARSLLSGHWGDQMLFSTAYLVDLLRRGAWRTVWRHTREYARYFGDQEASLRRRRLLFDAVRHHVPRAVAPPLKWLHVRAFHRRRPRQWFRAAFLDAALRDRYRLARFDRAFHSVHARAVYLEARSKYHVQCMEWNAKVGAMHGLDVGFPFLDRDLIAFLMAIPGEIHARNGVPRVLLREAMGGVLPDAIRTRTWKSDFSILVNEGLNGDVPVILRALHSGCLAVQFGYLDPELLARELPRLVEGLNAPDSTRAWDLADTYGLEAWLQVFFGQEVKNGRVTETAEAVHHAQS